VRDGAASLDRRRDASRVVGVDAVLAHDEDDLRADELGLADQRSRLDAESLRLVAGRDATGGVRLRRNHRDGTIAIFGRQLLIDQGEKAVEIDVEDGEAVRLESGLA